MRLKIPQQTQLSSLCLSNRRPSSVRRPAWSAINPSPCPARAHAREEAQGAGHGRSLRPSPSSPSPGECFVKREQNATASVCIGPKITPGGFAGDVVSASPTRSHPAVLFLLPVSLATPQLALAGEPGGRRLPAGAGGDLQRAGPGAAHGGMRCQCGTALCAQGYKQPLRI